MQSPMCLFVFYYYKFVWIQSKSVLIVCKYYCKSKLFNIKENLFSKANKNSISKNCLGITILSINVQGERKISGRDGSSKGNIWGDTCLKWQQSTNQKKGFYSLTNKSGWALWASSHLLIIFCKEEAFCLKTLKCLGCWGWERSWDFPCSFSSPANLFRLIKETFFKSLSKSIFSPPI